MSSCNSYQAQKIGIIISVLMTDFEVRVTHEQLSSQSVGETKIERKRLPFHPTLKPRMHPSQGDGWKRDVPAMSWPCFLHANELCRGESWAIPACKAWARFTQAIWSRELRTLKAGLFWGGCFTYLELSHYQKSPAKSTEVKKKNFFLHPSEHNSETGAIWCIWCFHSSLIDSVREERYY